MVGQSGGWKCGWGVGCGLWIRFPPLSPLALVALVPWEGVRAGRGTQRIHKAPVSTLWGRGEGRRSCFAGFDVLAWQDRSPRMSHPWDTPEALSVAVPGTATLLGTVLLWWPQAAGRWQHGLRRRRPALCLSVEQVGFQT